MAKQMGNSGRGPSQLDRAQKNMGQSDDQERFPNSGPLASGDERSASGGQGDGGLGEDELIGTWSENEQGGKSAIGPDEVIGPYHEDHEDEDEDGMSASPGSSSEDAMDASSQPGGSRPSESERPDSDSSRWGDSNRRR